jgi:hypothetical protein
MRLYAEIWLMLQIVPLAAFCALAAGQLSRGSLALVPRTMVGTWAVTALVGVVIAVVIGWRDLPANWGVNIGWLVLSLGIALDGADVTLRRLGGRMLPMVAAASAALLASSVLALALLLVPLVAWSLALASPPDLGNWLVRLILPVAAFCLLASRPAARHARSRGVLILLCAWAAAVLIGAMIALRAGGGVSQHIAWLLIPPTAALGIAFVLLRGFNTWGLHPLASGAAALVGGSVAAAFADPATLLALACGLWHACV